MGASYSIASGLVLGEILRRLRILRGVSRKDLCASSGITLSSISRIESGKQSLTITQLRMIAAEIGVRAHLVMRDWERVSDFLAEDLPGAVVEHETSSLELGATTIRPIIARYALVSAEDFEGSPTDD